MASRTSRRREALPDEQVLDQTENADLDEDTVVEDEAQLPAVVEDREVGAPIPVSVTRRPWTDYIPGWIPARIRNSIIELGKVTWPTTKEALNYTTTVIIFAVIFGVVFFAIDQLFTSGLSAITNRIVGH